MYMLMYNIKYGASNTPKTQDSQTRLKFKTEIENSKARLPIKTPKQDYD